MYVYSCFSLIQARFYNQETQAFHYFAWFLFLHLYSTELFVGAYWPFTRVFALQFSQIHFRTCHLDGFCAFTFRGSHFIHALSLRRPTAHWRSCDGSRIWPIAIGKLRARPTAAAAICFLSIYEWPAVLLMLAVTRRERVNDSRVERRVASL